LPIPPTYKTVNVAEAEKDPNSLLHWYEQLIQMKKQDPALAEGEEIMLNTSDNNVLSWLRKDSNGDAVVVACNFTDQPQTVHLDVSAQGIQGTHATTLLKSPGAADPTSLQSVQLGPYGVYIGKVE